MTGRDKTSFGVLLIAIAIFVLILSYRDRKIDLNELILILVLVGLGANFISQTLLRGFVNDVKGLLPLIGKGYGSKSSTPKP